MNQPKISVIVPCAGLGSRFSESGLYDKPKPLIDVLGKPMIWWVLSNFKDIEKDTNLILVVRKEHNEKYDFKKIVEDNFNFAQVNIVEIDYVTQGALETVYLARDKFVHGPLIVANSDQFYESFSTIDFIIESQGSAASMVTFIEPDPTSKWSFVDRYPNGNISRVAEKIRISNEATLGIYWFRDCCEFCKYAETMFTYNFRSGVANEFYLAPTANLYIMDRKPVKAILGEKNKMFGLGTPADLEYFLNNYGK